MKKNEELEKMLAAYRPELGDGKEYMVRLEQRLKTVEPAKELYETERKRNRSRLAVAFAAGGVTGLALSVVVLRNPMLFAGMLAPVWPQGWLMGSLPWLLNAAAVTVLSLLTGAAATLLYSAAKRDFTV